MSLDPRVRRVAIIVGALAVLASLIVAVSLWMVASEAAPSVPIRLEISGAAESSGVDGGPESGEGPLPITTLPFSTPPPPGLIQGRTLDRRGRPVPGVTLKAFPSGGEVVAWGRLLDTPLPPRHLAASQGDGRFGLDPPTEHLTYHLGALIGDAGWLVFPDLPSDIVKIELRVLGSLEVPLSELKAKGTMPDGSTCTAVFVPRPGRPPKPPTTGFPSLAPLPFR